MATVRVPSNVSSITTTTTGTQAPASGLITVTAAEATALTKAESWGPGPHCVVYARANGNCDLYVPNVITSITINGNVYPVTNGQISNVPAADVTNFITAVGSSGLSEFLLVQG